MRLLIVYSTIDGHTLEICERIAAIARATGHEVELARWSRPALNSSRPATAS